MRQIKTGGFTVGTRVREQFQVSGGQFESGLFQQEGHRLSDRPRLLYLFKRQVKVDTATVTAAHSHPGDQVQRFQGREDAMDKGSCAG